MPRSASSATAGPGEVLKPLLLTACVDRKIMQKVFDRPTLMNVYHLFNKGVFRAIGSPVSDGKEARVFSAENDEKLAVKVYKVEASAFRNILPYVRGDPRFWDVGRSKRTLINAWVKKEFGNLKRLYEAGVSVPKPYAFRGNVLVMEFIGGDVPAPQIRDVRGAATEEVFWQVLGDVRLAYHVAGLVHADLSEYNILWWDGKHVIIDLGQGVDVKHPRALEFLGRDVRNLCNFFGPDVGAEAALEWVIQPEGKKL